MIDGNGKNNDTGEGSESDTVVLLDERMKMVINVLDDIGACTAEKIALATGIPRTSVILRLQKLVKSGSVIRKDVMDRLVGRPKIYFMLVGREASLNIPDYRIDPDVIVKLIAVTGQSNIKNISKAIGKKKTTVGSTLRKLEDRGVVKQVETSKLGKVYELTSSGNRDGKGNG